MELNHAWRVIMVMVVCLFVVIGMAMATGRSKCYTK